MLDTDYKVLKVEWYNQCGARPLIGIVTIETKYNETKTYIGTAQVFDEKADISEIVALGAKFN